MIKKEARIIVEEQYGLNINMEDANAIALKVKGLLDETGPSNMAFTDGPMDKNVTQFFFLSKQKKI